MNTPLDPRSDWNPGETFERVARERGRSPEELRARLTQLADGAAQGGGGHLDFEALQEIGSPSEGGMVPEENRRHLEGCAFCSDLLASLQPPQERIEEFAQAAVAGFSRPRRATTPVKRETRTVHWRHPVPWAAAASLVVALCAGLAWQTAPLSAGNFLARFSPALAVKFASDPKWLMIEDDCGQKSGSQSACAYLTSAALYRADGSAHAARTLLVSGLEQVGVTHPVALKISDALQTPTSSVPRERQEAAQLAHVLVNNTEVPARWIEAARLQQKAGEHAEAIYAVDKYLTEVRAQPAATEAFRTGYAQTIAALSSERKPTFRIAPSVNLTDPAAAAASSRPDNH